MKVKFEDAARFAVFVMSASITGYKWYKAYKATTAVNAKQVAYKWSSEMRGKLAALQDYAYDHYISVEGFRDSMRAAKEVIKAEAGNKYADNFYVQQEAKSLCNYIDQLIANSK